MKEMEIKDLQNTPITCACDGAMHCENIDFSVHIDYIKLREDAIEPTRGSVAAAGYDLYVPSSEADIAIPAHQTVLVNTQIAIAFPPQTFGAIFARSGLATKLGLRPANCVGVVDSDYRGAIGVALHNDTEEERIVKAGERIAQLVVIPFIPITFEEQHSLEDTERGDGGFGSTGK